MTPRLRPRLLSIAAATALAAASVAGCGAEDKAKDAASGAKAALDPVAQASAATQAQEGGVALTLRGTVAAGGQQVPMEGEGVVDPKAKTGKFTLKTDIGGQSLTIDEIMAGKVFYVGGDMFRGKLPGGKKWLKVDLADEAAKQGLDLDALGGQATQDPTAALEYLKGAGTSRKVGTETVNGTKTTRYHVDVDLRKVAAKSGDAAAKKSVDKLIQSVGSATLPIDVWVDGKDLVRREKLKYDMTVQGQKAGMDLTIDFTKYGVDVDVEAPPASDVLSLDELSSASGGTTTS